LKAINDAVGGAVAFALLGAVLGTLVERLAAPFLNRFEERSTTLRLTGGAMCGGIIGGLAMAVFGIGLLAIVLVAATASGQRWQGTKVGEMVYWVVFPVAWGLFVGAVSGLYAARR
jgi:hypothetical protein